VKKSARQTRQTRQPRSLKYENLESREMMAITAGLNAGVLTITGSNVQDFINVQQSNGNISVVGVCGS